jgi:hypothetical protein
MASKKKLRRKIAKLKRRLRNQEAGIDYGDITLYINPEGNSVKITFNRPMIYTGADSYDFGGFNFNSFSFMTHQHPSLPYRDQAGD